MTQKLIVSLVLLLSLDFYGQINFEKGYYINNENIKVDCFIKNEDWKNNPFKIVCKNSLDDASEIYKDITSIKEFGVGTFHKYQKHEVSIDTSSVNINYYSNKIEPEWATKTLFLKILIEGEYDLFSFSDGNMKLFFYSHNDSEIEQLVYKKYLEAKTTLKENTLFKRQLFTKAKCESTNYNRVYKLEYNQKELSEYFLEINNCNGKNIVSNDYIDKNTKNKFNFNLKTGINSSSINYSRPLAYVNDIDLSFKNIKTYKFGIEIEYVFPFNKNKWALFFEPTYQTEFKSKATTVGGYGGAYYPEYWSVNYQYIDVLFGLRHYMYINNKSNIFVNLCYGYGQKLNGSLKNETKGYTMKILSKASSGLGIGYNYNKKYSIEFRYLSRDIFEEYSYGVKSKFESVSLILGYTIFENKKQKN